LKKKWLGVGIAAVLVLIGIVVLTQQSGKSPEEKALDEVLPKTQSARSVPAIEYMPVAEADGLKVKPKVIVDHWERGVLSASVSIENTRDEMLVTAKMTATSVSQSGIRSLISSVSINRLKSGETADLNLDMLEVLNVSDIKKVEISFDSRSVIWEEPTSTATPAEKTKQTEEPKEPEEPTPLQPTLEPKKVLTAWLDLMKKEKFAKAEEFLTYGYKKHLDAYGGLEKIWYEDVIKEIVVFETQYETKTAIVYIKIYSETGKLWDEVTCAHFEKINNEWKIDFISK